MKPTGKMRARAFTLVEVMISMTILIVILVLTVAMINQTSALWKRTTGRIAAFQEARAGFEALTRKASEATLNTYWDYVDASGNSPGSASYADPDAYARQSELHFISGRVNTMLPGNNVGHALFFQAPLGYSQTSPTDARPSNRLVASGFFVQYGPETARPKFIAALYPAPGRTRFRLMQMAQGTESLAVYARSGSPAVANIENTAPAARNTWFSNPIAAAPSAARPFAENIVALVVLPRQAEDTPDTSALTADYSYDTKAYNSLGGAERIDAPQRNQLPPLLQIAMVAIDEDSAARLERTYPSFASLPPELTTLFSNVSDYQKNFEDLEKFLQGQNPQGQKYNYRVFTTTVSIRQAKWSQQ